MNYCLGFIISQDLSKILLVRKTRGPEFLIGKLNGIGGKLDNDESGKCAMIRECREETGIISYDKDWVNFATLKTSGGIVYCYYFITDKIFNFSQKEDEKLDLFDLIDDGENGYFGLWDCVPNLRYLIPIIINHYKKLDKTKKFEIIEYY